MSGSPCRFIFCINSGRSGSQYLSTLLGTDPGVAAFHEAPPEMNGDLLRLAEREPYAATYGARRFKADAVRALLARQPGRSVYAETNHMFIKTFFDVAMREFAGERVGVVLLRRELAAVVRSFAELGIFTPRNTVWPAWMSDPYALTRAIEPAAPTGTLDALETTVAYLVDIEARAQRFLREYPRADVFETRIEAFADAGEIERLFAWAGLTVNDANAGVARAAGQRAQGAQGRDRRDGAARGMRGRRGALFATLRRRGHRGADDPRVMMELCLVVRSSPDWGFLTREQFEAQAREFCRRVNRPVEQTVETARLWDRTFRTTFCETRRVMKSIAQTLLAQMPVRATFHGPPPEVRAGTLYLVTDDDDWCSPELPAALAAVPEEGYEGVTWGSAVLGPLRGTDDEPILSEPHAVKLRPLTVACHSNNYALTPEYFRLPKAGWDRVFSHGHADEAFRRLRVFNVERYLSVKNTNPASTVFLENGPAAGVYRGAVEAVGRAVQRATGGGGRAI